MDSLPNVAPRKRKNPWTSTSEVVLWLLFVLLLVPVGFAGYAVGHYTSIGKAPTTVTVTVGSTGTEPTTTAETTTTSSATTTGSSSGVVAAGKEVYASAGCGTCHTFGPAGSSGTFGPDLDKAPAEDANEAGMPLAAFVRESIVNPNAYIAKGYTKPSGMPSTFGSSLTPAQIHNLVAFILSGTQQ